VQSTLPSGYVLQNGICVAGTGGGGTIDLCANIAGTQTSVPSGYVYNNGNCDPASSGTGGTETPGVPNTGAGGTAVATLLMLLASAAAAIGGARVLTQRTA
jgi:hypothetical protein